MKKVQLTFFADRSTSESTPGPRRDSEQRRTDGGFPVLPRRYRRGKRGHHPDQQAQLCRLMPEVEQTSQSEQQRNIGKVSICFNGEPSIFSLPNFLLHKIGGTKELVVLL